jgi:hypothetical protein
LKAGILYRNVQYYFQEKKRGAQLSDQLARGDVGFLRHFWNITESEIASVWRLKYLDCVAFDDGSLVYQWRTRGSFSPM